MIRRLDADPAFAGLVTKNPLHRFWRTIERHNHRFQLHELDEALHDANCRAPPRPEATGYGESLSLGTRRQTQPIVLTWSAISALVNIGQVLHDPSEYGCANFPHFKAGNGECAPIRYGLASSRVCFRGLSGPALLVRSISETDPRPYRHLLSPEVRF